jgi:hypothetical protein
MPKIKEIPLPPDSMIRVDELAKVFENTKPNESAHFSLSPSKEKHSYLIGTPYFKLNFKKDIQQFIPVGQYRSGINVFRKTRDKTTMMADLKLEYKAVIKALFDVGVDFRIVDLERGDADTIQWLRRKGCNSLVLPYEQVIHWQIFPRDMCVYIKEANTLLVHSSLFKIPSTLLNGCQIINTPWGVGGRVLLSGDHMLLGRKPGTRKRVKESGVIYRLREMGMKVGFIPHALFYGLSPRGEKAFLFHHSHIDLVGSLLKGRDGGFHLIMDPFYRTGPLADPLSVKNSIDLVRKNCDEIDIQVHLPGKKLSVPFSPAMVQFENNSVLATKGDDEVLAIVNDIIGSENLYVTDVPIVQYPMFGGAGLHCLITETPIPLISALGSL